MDPSLFNIIIDYDHLQRNYSYFSGNLRDHIAGGVSCHHWSIYIDGLCIQSEKSK